MIRSFIFIIIIFFSTNTLADEPEYSYSLNENIIEYGWKIKNTSNLVGTEKLGNEVITLHKNGWILKCSIFYAPTTFIQRCEIP